MEPTAQSPNEHEYGNTNETPTTPTTNNDHQKPGTWIGIDLGTSNCTAAFWDTHNNRAKLIRFPSASKEKGGGGSIKNGRLLPSCVYYAPADNVVDCNDKSGVKKNHHRYVRTLAVGSEAFQMQDKRQMQSNNSDHQKEKKNINMDTNNDTHIEDKDINSGKMVSSVKRIWAMTKTQIESELQVDDTFLSSCPFESTIHYSAGDTTTNSDDTTNSNNVYLEEEEICPEGARLCIPHSQNNNDNDGGPKDTTTSTNTKIILIPPLTVATDLLTTIRTEAQQYFDRERKKIKPLRSHPSSEDEQEENTTGSTVRHCVIGVPAHFSRNRCQSIVIAARKAGFDGHVSTIVESTAAAVAYGLNVATKTDNNNNNNNATDDDGSEHNGEHDDAKESRTKDEDNGTVRKNILVFDMGGGTTDVTIAQLLAKRPNVHNNNNDDEPTFQVLATTGDRHLGGDDMDVLLAQYLSTKLQTRDDDTQLDTTNNNWKDLRITSRTAKEKLCGDGTPDNPQKEFTTVTDKDKNFEITYDQFDKLIKPLMDRAKTLVQDTISSISPNNDTTTSTMTPNSTLIDTAIHIDEVILVGGATRTPSVISMLQNLFPTVEFCTSIHGMKAVAQGAAIQSALRSGLVPKHVVKNALMLDVLPHPIGVLYIPGKTEGEGKEADVGGQEEMYIPILERGMSLPAMNSATFQLAALDQKGVTIVAVEDVGDEFPLERLGEFTFLLHRLPEEELENIQRKNINGSGGGRTIEVGMTVETNGKFIVSIFDQNDPEHLKKKERYQEWKREQSARNDDDKQKATYVLGESGNNQSVCKSSSNAHASWEEIILTLACVAMFGLYIVVRVAFNDIDEGSAQIK